MIDWEALRALLLRARDGDRNAMGRLLTELSPKLRGYIRRQLLRCGQTDPADAEDLLQVTLLAMHTKQHTYDPAQPLGGWVYAIAHYKVVDHLRATQRLGRTFLLRTPTSCWPRITTRRPRQAWISRPCSNACRRGRAR